MPTQRIDPIIRLAIVALLVAFFVLAAMYSTVTPPWEAPDEVGHFAYVEQIRQTGRLPTLRAGELGEAHQPPLYYAIAALFALPAGRDDPRGALKPNPNFVWAELGGEDVNIGFHTTDETFPFRGQSLALHLARGVSVAMGTATVGLVMAIGLRLFPAQPLVGLLAGALVAFNPQFLFFSGAVSNDSLLTLAATGTWWQLLAALRRPEQWRQWFLVGLWASLAVAAELTGFVVVAVVGLVLLGCALQRRSPRLLFQGALGVALMLILVCGWWFIRDQLFVVRRRYRGLDGYRLAALAVLALAIVAQEATMLFAATRYNASVYQGRYLFPAIGPMTVLASLGLVSLLPQRWAGKLVAGLAVALAAVALIMPTRVIRPAYGIVPLAKWQLWFLPRKADWVFGGQFRLRGYRLDAQPGASRVSLTLYWQAVKRPDLDYSVFAHLIDASDQIVAQQDRAPGEIRGYPPTSWWEEDIIADEHLILLPSDLPHSTYRLRAGVYDWRTGQQLPVQAGGTYVILDDVLELP